MPHAYVTDVPASWDDYERLFHGADDVEGLILHAAGRTDEGFRIIEVWETEEAWRRSRAARPEALLDGQRRDGLGIEPAVRELAVERLLRP